jgi:hypothetical protein
MTRAENWNLILQLCAEAQDDVVDCLRIELLNDFGKVDEFSRGPNLKHLAASLRACLPRKRKPLVPALTRQKPVICFPASSSSNLQNLLPVAREAIRRNLLGGIVLGEAVPRSDLGVFDEFDPVVCERDLGGQTGISFFAQSFRRAGRRLKWMIAWLHRHDPHCAKRVRQNYGSYLRLMVTAERAQIACRNFLLTCQPSCVLTTSDFYPFEFQLVWQARKLGIPTSILQHGEPNDVVVWPTYADTFLAWGESYREQFLIRGAPANRLHVTGMPASDALFLKAQGKQTTTNKTNHPVCLVLSHTQDRIEDSVLFNEFGRCLNDTIRSTPGIDWRIKLHPSEDDLFYREKGISTLAQVEVLPRNVSLENAVSQADIVCTIRSTAGLQAMMLQKPVAVLDLIKQTGPPVSWPLHGGGIYVKNAEDFCNRINQLVSDANVLESVLTSQRQFLDLKFAHRGNAAAAVVNYLANQTSAGKLATSDSITLVEKH